jgi:esterase/lipase superfamily enzyme
MSQLHSTIKRGPVGCVLLSVALGLGGPIGCGSGPMQMMPTPNLYVGGDVDPFTEVPPELQNNKAEVIYLTDRVIDLNPKEPNNPYGFGRSRSVAYGVSQVEFGDDISWDDLVAASRSKLRSVNLPLSIPWTQEYGRFPPTPRYIPPPPTTEATTAPTNAAMTKLATRPQTDLGFEPEPAEPDREAADQAFRELLARHLEKTNVKEVYLFVHGFNNRFDEAVMTIAQLWHFFGRQGVPIAYTWPAGGGGLLRGYNYDRESGEFTIYHLKQALQVIASCPQVEKIHILAHSRGTDVATSALRELHIELRAAGKSTRQALKLGTVVLAAPDLDFDVVLQRLVTNRVFRVPEQFAMYVCARDEALGMANWLFSSATRLGRLQSSMFTPEELQTLRRNPNVQIIDARVSNAGSFGHDYFHSNPAVSSDLILLMRYQRRAGAQYGRPLRNDESGFWFIDDQYPGPPKKKATTAPTTQEAPS